MKGYEFKTYIKDGREYSLYGERRRLDIPCTKKDFPFPESLLSFLRLDVWALEPLFQKMVKSLRELYSSREISLAREIGTVLDELAGAHFYFEFLRLDWRNRLTQAEEKGFVGSTTLLPHRELSQIPSELEQKQKQIQNLISYVLDIDSNSEPVDVRMPRYYRVHGSDALNTFQFAPQPMSFELVDDDTFAEVLYPKSIYDLIDFHVRECVKRELRMRVCKNCGQYFAISNRSTAEYCDVTKDEKGRTCKEIGAIALWNQKRSGDDVFKVYRREYKKRFAWIKAGRIEPEAFYAWSEQAREKKAQCEDGAISLDEFKEWLGEA